MTRAAHEWRAQRSAPAALQACEKALTREDASNADKAGAAYHMALIYIGLYEYEAARTAAETALSLDPALADAHLARAATLIRLDRISDAEAAISEGLEGDLYGPHYAYYLQGVIRDRRNEFVPAYESFRRALTLKPGWPPAQQRLNMISEATALQHYLASAGN